MRHPMEASFSGVLAALRSQLAKEKMLTALGSLGVLLGAVLGVAILVRGVEVPPEGNLFETATFDGAVGIFILTLALLAPSVVFSTRGKRAWLVVLVPCTLYAYGIETTQALRGLDPRFSAVAGSMDQILGGAFFLAALTIMACFSVLALKFFLGRADAFALAVRYGALASWLAFGVGIDMSLGTTGRNVPEAGNLLPLHAVGFHGLQAIPLVALLLGWAGVPEGTQRGHVHLAGAAWLLACTAIAWQAYAGLPPADLSAATVLAAVLLLGWAVVAIGAARAWANAGQPPPGPIGVAAP